MAWSSLLSYEIPNKTEIEEALANLQNETVLYPSNNVLIFDRCSIMICWGSMYSNGNSVWVSFPMSFSSSPYIVTTENGRGKGASSYNKIPSYSVSGFNWIGDSCNGHYIAIGRKYW